MSVIFNLEKEFEIGDLKIKAYQYEHVTLFDPKYLIELVGEEFTNNERTNKQRILERINPEFIVKVDVREGGDNAPLYTGKKLLKAQGVYQLLFFLDSATANKICKSFVDILENYRLERGLTFDLFLRGSYKNKLTYIPNSFYAMENLSDSLINRINEIPEEDLYISNSYRFPIINDNPITSEEYNYEISDKLRIGMKVDFYVSCEKCIKSLSKLKTIDKVTTLAELLSKELRAYNIEQMKFNVEQNMATGMYFNGLELFEAIVNMNYGDHKFNVKLFLTIMKMMYNDNHIIKLLVDSVTKYHYINKNISTKWLEEYISDINNYYEY